MNRFETALRSFRADDMCEKCWAHDVCCEQCNEYFFMETLREATRKLVEGTIPVIDGAITDSMLHLYGWDNEKMVVVEEMAELTKEISKMERGKGNMHNLVEEIADVYIVLDLVKKHYRITKDELVNMIYQKEKRNRARLLEEGVEVK